MTTEEIVAELLAQAREYESAASQLRAAAAALGSPADTRAPRRDSTGSYVLEALDKGPLSVAGLLPEMTARGWSSSATDRGQAIRNALTRLRRQGLVSSQSYGVWELVVLSNEPKETK